MKNKGQICPNICNKTPTTPIRSSRINSNHHKQNGSIKSNSSINIKQHKMKDSDITDKQKQKDKTTVANTNVNTHIKQKNSKIEHNTIDEILHNISQNNGRGNSSVALYKKTQINGLRQMMQRGKRISKIQKNNEKNGSILDINNLQQIRQNITRQIKQLFCVIKKKIQKKQQQLLDGLQQNIFELKQHMINKQYQKISLMRGIQKCEKDINHCYDQIIQYLSIQQFQNTIKAYTQRFQFYMKKIQKQNQLKLKYPQMSELLQKINQITVQVQQTKQLTLDLVKIVNYPNQNIPPIESNKKKIQSLLNSAIIYL